MNFHDASSMGLHSLVFRILTCPNISSDFSSNVTTTPFYAAVGLVRDLLLKADPRGPPSLPRSFKTQPQFMPNLHVSAAHGEFVQSSRPQPLRTEREALASLGSHQANTPVIPIRQCTKRSRTFRAILVETDSLGSCGALKRLNFRIAHATSV